MIKVKSDSIWKDVKDAYVKVDGVWQKVKSFLKVAGQWVSVGMTYYIHAVADRSPGELRKIDPDGNTVWSKTGVLKSYVDVDPDGYIYSGYTSYPHGLYKHDEDGNEIWNVPYNTTDLAVGRNGNVYTVNSSSGIMIGRDSNGEEIWRVSYGSTSDMRRVFTSTEHVFNIGHSYLDKRDPSDGSRVWRINTFGRINMAVDKDGYIHLTGSSSSGSERTVKYTPDGEEIWNIATPHTTCIDVDAEGSIYLGFHQNSDSSKGVSGYIAKLDNNGNTIWESGGGTSSRPSCEDIKVDPDGYVYAMDTVAFNTISKFSPDGEEIWTIDFSGGAELAVSPGLVGVFPEEW